MGEVERDGELAAEFARLPAYRLLRRLDRRAVEVAGSRCLRYRGYHDRDGYPRINVAGVSRTVCHAIVASLYPWVTAAHDAHHECGNAWCINPEHLAPLERGTHRAVHRRRS